MDEFFTDLELVFTNAMTYNYYPSSKIHELARKSHFEFERLKLEYYFETTMINKAMLMTKVCSLLDKLKYFLDSFIPLLL